MKGLIYILLLRLLLMSFSIQAQLEKVIVEKYYISDAKDAADTAGGKLDSGSVTYRIYVDMKPGYRLKRVYGDGNHPLKISSTAHFFNNKSRGKILGKDISVVGLGENTTALDTWVTLGQVSSTGGGKTYFGVLKTNDTDGSAIGGGKNDEGLLVNANTDAGIPLTTEDGMLNSTGGYPTNFSGLAYLNFGKSYDSTIFGNAVVDSQFACVNTLIANSGAKGLDTTVNQVIIAQLTTKGLLSFELNIEIIDYNGHSYSYVANDSVLLAGETLSRYLKYVNGHFNLLCGCSDPDYMEYNPDRECDNLDSCKTKIILGCMDRNACNYDPTANVSAPTLCCYPGRCQDRDITLVCNANLVLNNSQAGFEFNLFPNPAHDQLNIQVVCNNKDVYYELYDFSGRILLKKNMGNIFGTVTNQLDISNYDSGLYIVRMYIGAVSLSKKFIKE